MSEHRNRARRGHGILSAGLSLALTTAGLLVLGAGPAPQQASAATAAPAWATATADGFASVDTLGQNGTYGGRDGRIVTVRTQADLEKYATAAEPYVIVVAGAITTNPVGKEIKVASAKTIVGSGLDPHSLLTPARRAGVRGTLPPCRHPRTGCPSTAY